MTIPEVVITSAAINNQKLYWDGRVFLRCNMYDNSGQAVTLRLRACLVAKRRLS